MCLSLTYKSASIYGANRTITGECKPCHFYRKEMPYRKADSRKLATRQKKLSKKADVSFFIATFIRDIRIL